jgi:hypothetical protein
MFQEDDSFRSNDEVIQMDFSGLPPILAGSFWQFFS